MALEIEISKKRYDELTALINERDQIVQKANEQAAAKNAVISVMLKARIEVAGHDPDEPRGPAQLSEKEGKYFLSVSDVPSEG